MKFVHASDLHIDSPLRGLPAYEGAPLQRVREATRKAFRNLVDLCLREEARFLVLAGDVFDGDWRDFQTGLFFVRELERLRATTKVFLVRGNHDAASEVTRWIKLPPHVHEFPEDAAATVQLDDLGVAVHGLSFAQRAMPESLVPRYPAPVAGALNIGVLHTSADGRPGHHAYAPCRVDELVQKGYDYWALGHVHAHEILHRRPWIVFSGNTQGRHVKEAGEKGCVLVTVDGREIRSVEHRALDVVRWRICEVVLDGDDLDGLRARAKEALARAREEADGRMVAARLVVRGPAAVHATIVAERARVETELRAVALEHKDEVWIEEIDFRTRPPLDFEALLASDGFVGDLLRTAQAARTDASLLEELALALAPLRDKHGEEIARAGFDLGEGAALREILDGAEALLAARLTEEA